MTHILTMQWVKIWGYHESVCCVCKCHLSCVPWGKKSSYCMLGQFQMTMANLSNTLPSPQ